MFSCICPLYLILQVETNLLRKLPHPSENIDMEVSLHTNFGVEVPPPRTPPVLGSLTEKFNQSELPDSQWAISRRAYPVRQSKGKFFSRTGCWERCERCRQSKLTCRSENRKIILALRLQFANRMRLGKRRLLSTDCTIL